jgi:hypothetical protein
MAKAACGLKGSDIQSRSIPNVPVVTRVAKVCEFSRHHLLVITALQAFHIEGWLPRPFAGAEISRAFGPMTLGQKELWPNRAFLSSSFGALNIR